MLKRNLIIAVIFIAGLFAVQTSAQNATLLNFANNTPITINDNGNATPYPSNINVTGVSAFTRMTVRLQGFSHTFPDDVDIILVGPNGQRAVLMSDAGGNLPVTNQTFIFAQTAPTQIPDATALTTNTFRPANYQNGINIFTDTFPAPGPGALTDAPADLSVFNGTNPNGIWSLYVVDDAGMDVGSIALGWDMVFTVPQVFTVTNTNDSGGGSLRDAITLAQDGDLIIFSSLFNTIQTINLLTALPNINRSITIQGTGANLLTVRRDFNAPDFRIFNILAGIPTGVAISGMTITGGNVGSGVTTFGGGINSQSHLTLTNVHVIGNTAGNGGGVGLAFSDGVFTNCTFSNNSSTSAAGSGGGINYLGDGGRTLRVINSTISGNHAANAGGGISNISSGGNSRLEITNSTITNNTAVSAGGVETFTDGAGTTATTTLRNSIIAGNSPNNLATGTSGGGAATFQTLGFNLSNDNFAGGGFTPLASDINGAPLLAPLALYGGQTPTHALLHASPAINAGDASNATIDQRGAARVFGATADIGAVEMRPIVVADNTESLGGLRFAISGVSAPFSDIQFDNTFFSTPRTIELFGSQLQLNANVNIIAPGANLVTISGRNLFRVFQVSSGVTATLSGMTITGGNVNSDGGGILNGGTLTVTHSTISGNTSNFKGGGILNNSIGSLTVANSTISGNTALSFNSFTGGGIHNAGRLTVINSTISGNNAPNGDSNGGGIYAEFNATTITNSTITNNSAAGASSAGGIFRFGTGTVTIRNSIVAGNVGNATQPDVVGSNSGGANIISNGFNLIGNPGTITFNQTGDQFGTGSSPLAPRLAPLALNGGTTPTHALFAGSSALDAGQSSGTTSDQRGSQRPFELPDINNVSDGADIGAFEAQTAPSGAPTVSISDRSLNEGNAGTTNFTFTVSLSAASGSSVTVAYQTADGTATAPSDYTAVSLPITLTFNGGETIKTITIPVIGDTTTEPNETFFVNLLSASGATIADGQGLGTIQNDDLPTISINDVFQIEGNSSTTAFTFNVSLSAASAQTVTVSYQTANNTATAGSDYTAIGATTLTFNPGETSKPVSVSVIGETVFELNEVFFVFLSNPVGATFSNNQGIGTIQNDDAQPTISIADISQNEGNSGTTPFGFNITLSTPSSQTVTVFFVTANGTATAGQDYIAPIIGNTITFNPGETSKIVPIQVNGDTTVEPNETFFLNLSDPTNATISDNQGLGTIVNDDGSCSYTLSPASPQTVPATSSNLNVNVTTSAGCAWTASTSTSWITINSGSSGNGNGTVNMTFAANTGSARSGSLTIAGQTYTINQAAGSVVSIRAPFDYDGDNKTDISIFRPAPGEWWINRSINGSTIAFQFGATTDKIVPADYTGDGKTDVAFWRPSNGQWFILRSEDSTFFAFPFGTTGDVPVPADYDGDGKADAAVFRESSLTWFISKSSGGTDIIGFGAAGDKPVVADYDGDRKADIAIIRPNGATGTEWWIRQSSNASVFALQFGTPTDKAMQGDFTGDGKADVAFWRPSTGFWFILRSEDFSFFAFPFGANGDTPVAGDYDGDGKFDAGVYRPSNFTWFIQRSTAGTLIQQFGIAGDLPTPSAFVP